MPVEEARRGWQGEREEGEGLARRGVVRREEGGEGEGVDTSESLRNLQQEIESLLAPLTPLPDLEQVTHHIVDWLANTTLYGWKELAFRRGTIYQQTNKNCSPLEINLFWAMFYIYGCIKIKSGFCHFSAVSPASFLVVLHGNDEAALLKASFFQLYKLYIEVGAKTLKSSSTFKLPTKIMFSLKKKFYF